MENRKEMNGRQDFRRNLVGRSVLKSQHDSPSPEGSLIRLLAGLLTLASSSWPPSQSLAAGSVAFWPALHDHSGGAVPDSHRVPY